MDPGHRGHQNVPGVEHALDHGEGPLHRRPSPVDAPVPEAAPDSQMVAPGGPPHRRRVTPSLHAEVRLVQVRHLPVPGEDHPAVVHRGRSSIEVPDEAEVRIRLGVELVAEAGPAPLLSL